MNILQCLALVVSSCTITQGRYLIRQRNDGKEFQGRNYVVMEGKNLTIPCHSKAKYGRKSIEAMFWQVLPRQVDEKWYNTITLVSQFRRQRPISLKRIGNRHRIRAKLVRNTHKLVIKNIKRHATATYRCVVVSMMNQSKHYTEVTYYGVYVKAPPRINSETKSPISLSAGNKLQMNCASSGNPAPTITWSRDGGQPVVNERTYKDTKGMLVVNNVLQTDQGVYTCRASNSVGNDARKFVVYVKVPAKIITKKPISYTTTGKDAKIECEAVGNPEPTFTWKWKNGSAQISLNEIAELGRYKVDTVHNTESSRSFLKIRNVHFQDFHDYMCFAKNALGFSTSSISLRQYSVPERPRILRIFRHGAKLDISWTYDSTGGKVIEMVVIKYSLLHENKWKNITIVNPILSRYTLKNLLPHTPYKLRLSARNEIGKSTWTRIYKVRTGKYRRPSAPTIEGIVFDGERLNINWSYAGVGIRKIDVVIIEYAKVADKHWRRVHVKNPSETGYSIDNLCLQTDYMIRLFVKNYFGKSRPTEVQYVRTDAKLEDSKTPTVSLGIRWKYESNKRKIKSVKIEYASTNSKEWSFLTIANPQVKCHVIKDLRLFTEYKFRMFAVDEMKDVLRSTVHFIKTVATEQNSCSKELEKSSSDQINTLSLNYVNHSDVRRQQKGPAKPAEQENNGFLSSLNITLVIVGAIFIVITFAMVWSRRQRKTQHCEKNEEVPSVSSLPVPDEN